MSSFIVICGKLGVEGGWIDALNAATNYLTGSTCEVAKIYRVRAGEPMGRIVAEVTSDGLRYVSAGRWVRVKNLLGVVYG
jgi:hypothetical protein